MKNTFHPNEMKRGAIIIVSIWDMVIDSIWDLFTRYM